MKTTNDGGPAFPSPMFTRQADGMPMSSQEYGLGGMTLRDYFAGQALAGFCAAPLDLRNHSDEVMAIGAYTAADAMLAAREGKQ